MKYSAGTQVGLPRLIRVYERTPEGDNQDVKNWADVESIFEMDYDVVMHPLVEGDKLDAIYVNMDSAALKRFKAGLRNPSAEQLQLADRRYVSGVPHSARSIGEIVDFAVHRA